MYLNFLQLAEAAQNTDRLHADLEVARQNETSALSGIILLCAQYLLLL